MKLVRLLVLLLLSGACWAKPSSHDREFESALFPQGSPLAAPVAGDPEKTMALVKELYRIAGPKIGSRFVEPVYLLVLGDLRPYGAWNGFMVDPTPEDEVVIEKLNSYLLPRGYSLHPRTPNDQGRVDAFSLRSLAGLERRTKESLLPWVPKYDRAAGWAGYYSWKAAIYAALPKERDKDAFHYVEGIMLGYPDSAVEQYGEFDFGNWPTTVDASIPSAYFYLNGVPIFSLRAQDADRPDVSDTEKRWEKFLADCYRTTAHKELARTPEFIEARSRLHAVGKKNPLFTGDGRYAEARRLGLTARRQGQPPLTSSHERWLKSNSARLLQAIGKTSDLVEIASVGHEVELTSEHLWSWLLRGSFEPGTPAATLFEEFNRLYPNTYANLYRRELDDRTKRSAERSDGSDPIREGRPLVQLLSSRYLQTHLETFPETEQLQTFLAAESRGSYPPLEQLIAEADQGRGAYAKLLTKLRKGQPTLWKP